MIAAIANILAQVLLALTRWTGSAVVAIVLLTLVVKLVLHPLTRRQLKSMKAMQVLAPQLTQLREKYRDNPQQMNTEVMNLYRAHSVNPFGGCLPLVLQIPILWGLFAVFRRPGIFNGATFFGIPLDKIPSAHSILSGAFWAQVASQPIVLILIVLVGISTYLQQRVSITDPQQARIYMFMPIMFAVFAAAFPVGLSIYWITYSVVGTAEYLLVAGRPAAPGAASAAQARPAVLPQRPKGAKKR